MNETPSQSRFLENQTYRSGCPQSPQTSFTPKPQNYPEKQEGTEEEAYILSRDYSVCGREEKMSLSFNVNGNNESKVKKEQGNGDRERKEQRVAPAPAGAETARLVAGFLSPRRGDE